MRSLVAIRRSRKRRICDACGQDIVAGEQYEDSRLPPGSDIGNTTWWRSVSHLGEYVR